MLLLEKNKVKNIYIKIDIKKIFGFSGIIIILTFIVLIVVYWRLYFGVDFTDEAFYIAIPYRFALGDRPFIDELSMGQTSSFINYPFVKFHLWLNGNTDGIVLFMRHIYLFFSFFVASIIFITVKNILRWQEALVISLMVIAFVPFNIPTLSYNTIGMGFLTAGCFSGLWVLLNNKKCCYLFFSGIFFGFAIISYPTLLIPAFFYILSIILLYPCDRKKNIISFFAGLLPLSLTFLLFFISCGMDNIINSCRYTSSFGVQGGGLTKITKILYDLLINQYYNLLIPIFLIIYWKIPKISTKFLIYIIIFLLVVPVAILFFNNNYSEVTASMKYMSFCSFLAPIVYFHIKNNKVAKQLFYIIWIPSFIAGIVTAWTSGNGYASAIIGLFPGSITTFILLVILFKEETLKDRINILYFISPLLVTVVLLFFQYSSVYEDDKISDLNFKIKSGPFEGLYTSEEKNNYIERMQKDISEFSQLDDKILFYDNFPAGYLLSNKRAATNTVWLFSSYQYVGVDRQSTIDYYKKNNIKPDVVVKILNLYIKKDKTQNIIYLKNDPLNDMIEGSEYKEVLSRRDYKIFRKKQ